MGFMGLSHWVESDGAADFRSGIVSAILEDSVEELKNEGNEYNTRGAINVALVLESGLYEHFEDYELEDYKDTLFLPLINGLKVCLKEYGKDHSKAIKRMIKNVEKFCEKRQISIK